MQSYLVVLRINGFIDSGNIAGAQSKAEDIVKNIKKLFKESEVNIEISNRMKSDTLKISDNKSTKEEQQQENPIEEQTENKIAKPEKRKRGRPKGVKRKH